MISKIFQVILFPAMTVSYLIYFQTIRSIKQTGQFNKKVWSFMSCKVERIDKCQKTGTAPAVFHGLQVLFVVYQFI